MRRQIGVLVLILTILLSPFVRDENGLWKIKVF